MDENTDIQIRKSGEYLSAMLVNPYERIYYVGTKKRGITIHKQQIRSFNLVFALQEAKIINSDSRIAIVGGGIAGISATAACLNIGCNVDLFEKKPILVHLQTGCKTRWIHPNIYDWPLEGAEFPYSRLPMLNWKEGYSSDVAQSLVQDFSDQTKKFQNNYNEFLSATFTIELSKRKIHLQKSSDPNLKQAERDYDVIIFATGYGLESGSGEHVSSYWRNDDLDQSFTGSQRNNNEIRKVIISGTGDGATIELLRATLLNFHQGRLISDLVNHSQNPLLFEESLRKIRHQIDDTNPTNGRKLYDHFDSLPRSLIDPIKSYLRSQLRNDNEVILLGKNAYFSDIVSSEKMSLVNAFTLQLLYSIGAFTYTGVTSISVDKGKRIIDAISVGTNKKTRLKFNLYIPRHGAAADFENVLSALSVQNFYFDDKEIDTSQRHWSVGWPSLTSNSDSYEFVPPMVRAITSTFVEILGSNLIFLHLSESPKFRLTFLRFISINGLAYYQQVCRYSGTTAKDSKQIVGRVFSSNYGIVGFSLTCGKPVVLKREKDFEQAIGMMGVRIDSIPESVQSMLCIPIFGGGKDSNAINSVLYVDSSEKDFFDLPDVIETIILSCKGFVNNIEEMVKNKEVKTSFSTFNGIESNGQNNITDFDSLTILQKSDYLVTFDTIGALEIYE